MTRTFIETPSFSQSREELGIDDETMRMLEQDIMKHPDKYPVMKGTGGLRKAKVSIDNKGKSGGARVCFVDFVMFETVYFIAAYGKKDKANLTKKERNNIKKLIDDIERSLEGE